MTTLPLVHMSSCNLEILAFLEIEQFFFLYTLFQKKLHPFAFRNKNADRFQ